MNLERDQAERKRNRENERESGIKNTVRVEN